MAKSNYKNSSNINQISKIIVQIEKELCDLRLKKATRQNFKSHTLKLLKRRLAKLKTSIISITLINDSFE